ncbi:MAG: MotA/TolQ/ExbB proton channel family protein [Planctomycetia bacterium]|nr:MotA/TolQ/ExbB proton channel family protein [Planctomycetia bacterium]
MLKRSSLRGIVTLLLALTAAGMVLAQGQAPAPSPVPGPVAASTEQMPEIPSKNLWHIILAGGVIMLPIAFCSVLTTVFGFERLMTIRRGRVIPLPFVKRFLHQLREGQLDREKALALCQENGSPVAEVFSAAIRKWGKPAVEVEQGVLDAGERTVNSLRRYLRVFNGVATISPLLGLLGTVFGMIKAFNEISSSNAMGRPELLAGGISEALITTAAGLTVAIPALSVYLYFVSRVDQLIIEIDALGQELVQIVSDEGLVDMPQIKTTRTRKDAA